MVKRIVDVTVALLALALLSPVLAGVAVAVRWAMGSPVLFRQVRPGWQGRPFVLVKFRTMNEDRGPAGKPLPDAARITPLGHFLRRVSLDELPQLWNVLKGDLSLVGPRPLLMSYLPRYSPEQARRHEVPPGITGWAQINGRNAISWEEKFAYDVWYVDHWSLWLDLVILVRTLARVVRGEGVNESSDVTMREFVGYEG